MSRIEQQLLDVLPLDLTRAWRGQAYCLVEQGKWDEAATLYHKCLALDPNDSRAKDELKYVEKHRPR